jgi:N-acyl-phosphatidylethanolamine-hydrolysing phospholipase D
VPLCLKDWFTRRGLHEVVELDWWQSVRFKGVERLPELSFFLAGDTGDSKDFADIRARFGGFDLAAIPIGAYAPRWCMQIHWGTFDSLTDESLYEPPQLLAAERERAGLRPSDFFVLKHGETRTLKSHEAEPGMNGEIRQAVGPAARH